jgi:hypothetical protein
MLRAFASVLVLFFACHLIAGQEKSAGTSIDAFVGTWRLKSTSGTGYIQLPKDTIWVISASGDEITIEMKGYPFRVNTRYLIILDEQTLTLRPGLDG